MSSAEATFIKHSEMVLHVEMHWTVVRKSRV